MQQPTHFRQGDVLLVKTTRKPTKRHKRVKRDDRGRIVLAEGELTGHAHAIGDKGATLYETTVLGELDRILRVASGVSLRHEEHDTIKLPAGTYEVRQQREYEPGLEGGRFVED